MTRELAYRVLEKLADFYPHGIPHHNVTANMTFELVKAVLDPGDRRQR